MPRMASTRFLLATSQTGRTRGRSQRNKDESWHKSSESSSLRPLPRSTRASRMLSSRWQGTTDRLVLAPGKVDGLILGISRLGSRLTLKVMLRQGAQLTQSRLTNRPLKDNRDAAPEFLHLLKTEFSATSTFLMCCVCITTHFDTCTRLFSVCRAALICLHTLYLKNSCYFSFIHFLMACCLPLDFPLASFSSVCCGLPSDMVVVRLDHYLLNIQMHTNAIMFQWFPERTKAGWRAFGAAA